jgi:hypothetical protein
MFAERQPKRGNGLYSSRSLRLWVLRYVLAIVREGRAAMTSRSLDRSVRVAIIRVLALSAVTEGRGLTCSGT